MAARIRRIQIKTRVFTELAWHSLFIRTLLIRPEISRRSRSFVPELTIIDLPSFRADPKRHGCKSENVVAIDFARKIVLIGGSYYAGEMKKSVFTTLNYYLPEKGVMPMHCSANVGPQRRQRDLLRPVRHRQDHALGRSQAHADRRRRAWLGSRTASSTSKAAATPSASSCRKKPSPRFMPPASASARCWRTSCWTRIPGRLISTTAPRPKTPARPIRSSSFPNASRTGRAGHPKNLVMLAADAFGVMPPIAKLTPAQAMYHFLSGYTAKVAGTERGLGNDPRAGILDLLRLAVPAARPFGLRQPAARPDCQAQCRLLAGQHRLDRRQVWHRQPDADQGDARAVDRGARTARLRNADFRTDKYFGFAVPTSLPGRAEPHILDPIKTWDDKAEFDKTARSVGRHVPEELCQVRSPGRRRGPRRRAGPEVGG